MEAMYLAKEITNEAGELTGYNVRYQTETMARPSNHRKWKILKGINTIHPMAILDENGQWIVVEDTEKVARAALRATRLAESLESLDGIVWAEQTTIAKLRSVVKDLHRVVMSKLE